MDARTQRTLYRLAATLLILGVGVAIVIFVHEDMLRVAGIGLAAAAILSIEEWLKNTGDNAAPSVAAVNATLQSVLDNPIVSVPPPNAPTP